MKHQLKGKTVKGWVWVRYLTLFIHKKTIITTSLSLTPHPPSRILWVRPFFQLLVTHTPPDLGPTIMLLMNVIWLMTFQPTNPSTVQFQLKINYLTTKSNGLDLGDVVNSRPLITWHLTTRVWSTFVAILIVVLLNFVQVTANHSRSICRNPVGI